MNFGGYVPLNRGLIEHTMTGQMTNNEALVFVWLLMLADRKTGSYTINQPTLRTFLPGLSKDAAQEALAALERKRYIYRDVKPREKLAYRYWIAGFAPTDGPHKFRQLDLSEVFESRDTSKLRYVKLPPETPPQTRPAARPQTPNSNKKGEEIPEKETPSLHIEERAQRAQRVSTEGSTCGGASAPQVRIECATTARQLPTTARQLPPGFELKDDGNVYRTDGVQIAPNIVAAMLGEEEQ